MQNHKVVSREEWLVSRQQHLAREKEFTRLRDELSQERRKLPWVKVEKNYTFDSSNGSVSLSDLFQSKSQLIVYHFMFGPAWTEGCPSCSFWADNFNGIGVHLNHRDTTLVAISRVSLDRLEAYRKRMSWSFPWISSLHTDFNQDYHVSFTAQEDAKGDRFYNYQRSNVEEGEFPGISVFYKSESGEVFHTYSCYSRGLDMLNGAYHFLDLTPKGRDEAALPWSMAWLRRHDQYLDSALSDVS